MPVRTAPKIPDCELMRAMARGDCDALGILAARYSGTLIAHAWRVLRDQSDAQEVAADVLWQVWRDSSAFSPARGAVATWLITLARNRAIDRLRVKRPYQSLNGHMVEGCAPDPATEIDQAQRARLVRAAIARLEPPERSVLELAYFSDLSHPEIARQLGIPLGTVKTRMRCAITKLRQTLAALKGPGKASTLVLHRVG